MYRCENGPCVQASLRCNGVVDCPLDISDELDCPPMDNEIERKFGRPFNKPNRLTNSFCEIEAPGNNRGKLLPHIERVAPYNHSNRNF